MPQENTPWMTLSLCLSLEAGLGKARIQSIISLEDFQELAKEAALVQIEPSLETKHTRSRGLTLFWIVLFADILWLFLQFGGLAVVDLLVHASFLLMATGLLLTVPKTKKIQMQWYVWLGLPLLLGLIQMLRVPPEWMAGLNPVKHTVVAAVREVYPQLTTTSELTMMPQLHRFHFLILALDVYLALLLLMAPRPSEKWVTGFVQVLALIMALLNILASSNRIQNLPFIDRFQETYGGLINPNHFATLSAVFIVYLLGFLIIRTRHSLKAFLKPNGREAALEDLGSMGITVLCLGFTLISFRSVYSRSGLVVLILMLAVLLGYGLLQALSPLRLKLRIAVCVCALLSMFLFFPLGRGIDKFAEKNLDNLRITQLKIGLDYVAQKPWLGVGLGSTKSILHPLVPRETVYDLRLSTDFHNEYLQIAVEYGLVGILVLASMLGWLLWRLFPRESHKHFSHRILLITSWCMLVGFCFHALFSFPLRVTAIRVFVMVMIAFALKIAQPGHYIPSQRKTLVSMMLSLITLIALLAANHFPASKYGELVPGSLAEKAYRYGSYDQVLKYQANDQLQKTLNYLGDIEGLQVHMAQTRDLFNRYLEEQPFSLQALNGLFMLDVIDYRLNSLDFDAVQFKQWEEQVEKINLLGKNRNINARLAKFFLYANYLDHLTPTQRSFYDTMKTELAFRYKDAEEKAEDLFSEQ